MLQNLFYSKSKSDYRAKLVLIHKSFDYNADRATQMPSSVDKSKLIKILDIVNKILDFNEKNQQGQGLKILTPNQMLSRLQISLAQLKVGNNSVKLQNEIRQLLYFCTDQKTYKATQQKFDWHYLKMETIFIKGENSETSEPHRIKLDLTDKLDLKGPKKHGFSQFEYLFHLEKR